MNAVLAAELNERRAGVMFSEDRDDLRLGEARLAHMSFLFGLSAGETHDFKWPGLPGQRQSNGGTSASPTNRFASSQNLARGKPLSRRNVTNAGCTIADTRRREFAG